MDELKKALKPVKRKIFIEKAACWMMLILSLGFFSCAGLILLAKFIFIEHLYWYFLSILLSGLLLFTGVVIKIRPDDNETAQKVDLLGFKERFTTVFQWEGEKNALYKLVAEDTLNCARNNNISKMYKIKVHSKIIFLFMLSAVLVLFSAFVPSPNKDLFQNIKVMREEELKKINAFEEKSKDTVVLLDEKDQIEAERILNQLRKDLKTALTQIETQNAENTAAEELMKLSKDSFSDDLKTLSSMLKDSNGSDVPIKERQNLASEMIQMMNEWDESSFNELLEQMEAALSAEDSDALKELLERLEEGLYEKMAFSEAAAELSKDFNEMFLSDEIDGENTSANVQDSEAAQETEAKGLGQASGQGASGRGDGHIENQEGIAAHEINKDFQIFSPKGNFNEEGKMLENDEKRLGSAGEYTDYEKIAGEYSREALSSLDSEDLPYGMKEIIRAYFSGINE